MSIFKIKKGLDLPIVGSPKQEIDPAKAKVSSVGVVCVDFPFLKPILEVKEGDKVKVGSPLFLDNKSGHKFTSIGGGVVKKINRGERRKLLSIEIGLDSREEYQEFKSFSHSEVLDLSSEAIKEQLITSGMWNRLRTRPFSKVPNPNSSSNSSPRSIFVTAIDTAPLAPDPKVIIKENAKSFALGLDVLAKINGVPVNVCITSHSSNASDFVIPSGKSLNIFFHFFSGPHPAGLVGTHIHKIDPITSISDEVWHLGYQDVIAIGKLFETGRLFVERYVSLAGPQVKNPRILKVREGVNLEEIVAGETLDGENRVVSGSILSGHSASEPGMGFLSHFTNTVSVLQEDRRRFFHGFVAPGFNDFSVKPIMASKLLGKGKRFAFGTLLNGSTRDVVPIGSYEKVMPLDIEITYLVRALLMDDLENAEKLGALELDEEDLALTTFVCPGKNDIGLALSNVLKSIEKENS